MRVAIGSDDVYSVADFIVKYLKSKNFEIEVFGAIKSRKLEPWPEVAWEVARQISEGKFDFGILICYTGTGVSIAANKIKGVRAALCFDAKTAEGARLWNDANILAISARWTSEELAKEIIDAWLSVKEPDPSELENINKIKMFDKER